MSTASKKRVEFDQREMFVIGREIMVGGQSAEQARIKVAFPVIGEVVGAPSHWTLSGDGQLESFVLKFPHRFETPANMQCIYLAVMLNSESLWITPSGEGVLWEEELAGPATYTQLVQLGLFSRA